MNRAYSNPHDIEVGTVFTRFGEKVVRVEHLTYTDEPPAWFNPRNDKSHSALHKNGVSVYTQIEINQTARDAAHPFTNEVAPQAIQQLSLL